MTASSPTRSSPPEQNSRPRLPVERVVVSPRDVWRGGLTLVGVVALALFCWFVLRDGGAVIFTVLMSWFAALAMEPPVRRLSRHMRRGAATGIVMAGVAAFLVLFLLAFGNLFLEQVAQLLRGLPGLVDSVIGWVNQRFSTDYRLEDILGSIKLSPAQLSSYANQVLGAALSLVGSVFGAVFSMFTFGLLTFYLSADGPRLRRWIASLLPARAQRVFIEVWDITTEKTGGYVAARVVLAAINGGTSALVFLLIGMPSWLALGIWTGLVAQFVPTIGTYISIVLPVLVGLLSPRPWIGVVALGWALLYQQIENLTIEPKISAKAVDVHPAVAFAAVLLGTALFGVAGAVLAVPVAGMLLALLDIYATRQTLVPEARRADEIATSQHAASAEAAP